MSRKASPAVPARSVPIIHPRAIYDLNSAREILGLAKGCLPREIRLGRLRCARRAGKYLITGQWLLEWIEGGEVHRTPKVRPQTDVDDVMTN